MFRKLGNRKLRLIKRVALIICVVLFFILPTVVTFYLAGRMDKANEKKIPVFGSEIEQVKIGCLAAEGIDYIALGKQTGKMAAKVLKGEAKASEQNFETITEPGFYVNNKVAENLGITVPDDLANNAVESFDEITAE